MSHTLRAIWPCVLAVIAWGMLCGWVGPMLFENSDLRHLVVIVLSIPVGWTLGAIAAERSERVHR